MSKVVLLVCALSVCSLLHSQTDVQSGPDATPEEREDYLAIQLFLDANNFGPGRLDAFWGQFTSKAALHWNEANPNSPIRLKSDGKPEANAGKSVWLSKPLFTTYTISAADLEKVGWVPQSVQAKSEKSSLPYISAVELVAEKFHSADEYILELNPGITHVSAGTVFKVPNVAEPFDVSAARTEQKNSASSSSIQGKNAVVMIDRQANILELVENGKLVCSFPVTPGSDSIPAPEGEWKVTIVAWMPEFRYDEQMLKKGERSDNAYMLPPGPNNPVGIVWIGLSADGIGIHGTNNPDDIGRNSSAGCIRLSNWDALNLGKRVSEGTKVVIK